MKTHDLHEEHDQHHEDPASKTLFGFWIYIMTDAILFATLFATYAVLHHNTYGGPGIGQVACLPHVFIQTLVFLVSSVTYGLSFAAFHSARKKQFMLWLGITFLLGLGFLGMQMHEFANILHSGYSWQSSAFLSTYFTLMGIFSIHVVMALVWILILALQTSMQGLSLAMKTRFTCLGFFWNFLNLMWIVTFTIVYLMGAN